MLRAPTRALLLLPLLPLLAGAAGPPRIVVAKSSELSAYASVVAGFSAEVKGQVEEVTLPEGATAVEKAMEEIGRRKPALVLAVGPSAATSARRLLSGVPVVFTMVPYYERYGLEAQGVTGIALTNDLSLDLAVLASATRARRVGVLYDPRYSRAQIADARRQAEDKGLQLVALELSNPSKVEAVLEGARGKVDAMVMLADKTVATADVVRRLIAFTRDAKLPLVALSASQVKEGAMLSLSPSYTGIGQQAGRLANRIVHEKIDPGALAVSQPEVLELSVNLGTTRAIGGAGELALELLTFAAQRGYPIKVFE